MTPVFGSRGHAAMRTFRSGNGAASSSANNPSRAKAIEPVDQHLAPSGETWQDVREPRLFLAQHASFGGEEAGTHMLGIDTQRAQIPADVPLLQLSPTDYTYLRASQASNPKARQGGEGDGHWPDSLALSPSLERHVKEREENLNTPKPTQVATGLSQSQQDNNKEVKLLVSTLGYYACTEFAKRACYSGPPSKWTLFDECESEEVSLVTNVSSEVARKAFSYLTGKRLFTLKARPLCVMYMEPRNGGKVLVQGLLLPDDPVSDGRHSKVLMQKLCDFFSEFEM